MKTSRPSPCWGVMVLASTKIGGRSARYFTQQQKDFGAVNGNLGNISYVLCAIVGALLALSGYTGLTLGTLVAFLNLSKNSTQPVSQISQQTSSIVMAMAGAQRIFDLMDDAPERKTTAMWSWSTQRRPQTEA